MSTVQEKPKQIGVQLEPKLRLQLEQRARVSERSIVAEIRVLVRRALAIEAQNSEPELASQR